MVIVSTEKQGSLKVIEMLYLTFVPIFQLYANFGKLNASFDWVSTHIPPANKISYFESKQTTSRTCLKLSSNI